MLHLLNTLAFLATESKTERQRGLFSPSKVFCPMMQQWIWSQGRSDTFQIRSFCCWLMEMELNFKTTHTHVHWHCLGAARVLPSNRRWHTHTHCALDVPCISHRGAHWDQCTSILQTPRGISSPHLSNKNGAAPKAVRLLMHWDIRHVRPRFNGWVLKSDLVILS